MVLPGCWRSHAAWISRPFRLWPRGVLLRRWLFEHPKLLAQRPGAMPGQKLSKQDGQFLDGLVGPLLPHENIGDALRAAALADVALAPARLLLGVGQRHGWPPVTTQP